MSVASIIGKSSSFSFHVSVSDVSLKRGEFVVAQHDVDGLVLGMIHNLYKQKSKSGEIETLGEVTVIGFRDHNNIKRIPKTPFAPGALLWRADSAFIAKILGLKEASEKGLYIGLLDGYSDLKIYLDPQVLVTKHIAVLAQSGSGKSYAVGVLLEELTEKGIPVLVIDPHGEYSSIAYPNENKKELELMKKFDVKPKAFAKELQEFTLGFGEEDERLLLSDEGLSSRDLSSIMPTKLNNQQLYVLYECMKQLKEEKGKDYHLQDIVDKLEGVEVGIKWGILGALEELMEAGIFSELPTDIEKLVAPNKISIINLKGAPVEIQQIAVYRLLTDLFRARKMDKIPPFLLVVEEAHNFCPERSFGTVASSAILRTIASEGRKFGLGLCAVTQRPARIDKSVVSQCNTQLILKMTNPNDVKAIAGSIEKFDESMADELQGMPPGTAIICGETTEANLKVEIRVKKTSHGGEAQNLSKKRVRKKTEITVLPPVSGVQTVEVNEVPREYSVQKQITHPLWCIQLKNGTIFIDALNGKVYKPEKVGIATVLKYVKELPDFNALTDSQFSILSELFSEKEFYVNQEYSDKLNLAITLLLASGEDLAQKGWATKIQVGNLTNFKVNLQKVTPTIDKTKRLKIETTIKEEQIKKTLSKLSNAIDSIQLINAPVLICAKNDFFQEGVTPILAC